MNSDTLTQLLQKSFRVTLGATATLIEALQDPQRREANLSKLTTELSQLTQEWESKGTTTESEARNFVDTMWNQNVRPNAAAPDRSEPYASDPSSSSTLSTPVSASSPAVQQDLQELTVQIAAIRAEIERLRSQDS